MKWIWGMMRDARLWWMHFESMYMLELNVQLLIAVRYISLGRKNTTLQKSNLGVNILYKILFHYILRLNVHVLLVAALSADRHPSPVFQPPLPIRKTRAGLQFTCAAPTLGLNAYSMRDVWVCNSDGYVGQVCVLSLQPEPTVISCNGVCNARILCIASIPAGIMGWGYWNVSYVRSVFARLHNLTNCYPFVCQNDQECRSTITFRDNVQCCNMLTLFL